jgi:hypothetical protein
MHGSGTRLVATMTMQDEGAPYLTHGQVFASGVITPRSLAKAPSAVNSCSSQGQAVRLLVRVQSVRVVRDRRTVCMPLSFRELLCGKNGLAHIVREGVSRSSSRGWRDRGRRADSDATGKVSGGARASKHGRSTEAA